MKTTDLQHTNPASRLCEQSENFSKDAIGASPSSPEAQPSEENNELKDFDFNEEIYNELSGRNSKQEDEWEYYYPDDDYEYEYDPNHKDSQTIHILERERTPEEEHALSEFIAQKRNERHLKLVYHEILPNKMLKVVKEESDPEWYGGTDSFTTKPPMLLQVLGELNDEERHELYEKYHELMQNYEPKIEYYELLPNGILKLAASLG